MFICHKCGYKYYRDKEKTTCPICGTNILMPKHALFLFLSFVGFIVFSILSVFNDKFTIFSYIFITLAVVMTPFAIIEAINRMKETKDGFRTPDYPSELINGKARVPDFKSYDYVYGLKNDKGVKKILLEVHNDNLNFYYNKLNEIESIDYSEIVGLELHEENELKMSTTKSIIYAALLSAVGGVGAGMVGGVIGGIENKNRCVLEIQIKHNDELKSLYITSSKPELEKLAVDIENKVNGK